MEKRNSRTHKWRKRIPLMFLSLLCDPQMILSKCDPIFLFHTHSHQRKERCKLHNVDLHLAQTGIPTAGNRKTVHRPVQSATASRGLVTAWGGFLFSCSCTSGTCVSRVYMKQRLPGHNRERKTMHASHPHLFSILHKA